MGETVRCSDCGKTPKLERGSNSMYLVCGCIGTDNDLKMASNLDSIPEAWKAIDSTLEDMPEMARVDYIACEEKGRSYNEQARKRGVAHTTVMANVERAKDVLEE